MGEIHEGVCGAHQSAFKMKWMIRRNGYYWPTILEDCFKYFKGCQECQKFGNIQRAPASADDYATLMKDELDDLAGHRLKALMSIEENKKRVAR